MSNTGEVLGTAGGAIVGFWSGGPVGAVKGAAMGYSLFSEEEKSGEGQSPRYSFDKPQNTASSTRAIPVVYGKNLVTGNIIYKNVYGDNDEFADIQVAVSEGEINTIQDIRVNNRVIADADIKQLQNYYKFNLSKNTNDYEVFDTKFDTVIKVITGYGGVLGYSNFLIKPLNPDRHSNITAEEDDLEGYYIIDAATADNPKVDLRDFGFSPDKFRIRVEQAWNRHLYSASIPDVNFYYNYISRSPKSQFGTRVQPADEINENGETFPYVAYETLELTANEEVNGDPTISSVVEGLLVEVWDGSQWVEQFSRNPAYCLLDLITNSRYGLGIDKQYIDLNSFISAGDYCEELVDDGDGGQEPRFRLDYVIDSEQRSLDMFRKILSTFRAYLIRNQGEIRLEIDKPQSIAQTFDMSNIVMDSFSYDFAEKDDIPNQVQIEYVSQEDWDTKRAKFTDDYNIREADEIRDKTVSLLGISRFSQAGREAKYYLRKAKYCNTFCSFKAGIDSIQCEAGDVIEVSHDLPEWASKKFRIIEMKESQDDEMELTCQEYNEAVFSDSGVVQQPEAGPSLPNPFDRPQQVVNIQLTESKRQLQDGTYMPAVEASWDEGGRYRGAKVYTRTLDSNWQFEKEVSDTSCTIENIQENVEYYVKVVTQGEQKAAAFDEAPTLSISIAGKQTKPSDVTFKVAESSFANEIQLAWNSVSDSDLQAYEVRTDLNFGNSTGLICRKDDLEHRISNPQSRSYTYYIKTLDRSGNYSTNYDEITLNNSAPPAPNLTNDSITEWFDRVDVDVPSVSDEDIQGYKLYITYNATGETTIRNVPTAKTENINLDAGESVDLQVSAYDSIGEGSKSQVISATAQQIGDIAKFAQKLRPPELVDSLPNLPEGGYPEGKLVVLKSDKTMYQNINGDWDDDFDIEGLNEFQNIIASTVIAGAIGAEEANIREILTEALDTKDLQATLALIEEAYINDANIRNLSAGKINSGKMNADIVKSGKQVFETTESSAIESTAMPGITIDDEEVTERWDGHVVDGNGEKYYDKDGSINLEIDRYGNITTEGVFDYRNIKINYASISSVSGVDISGDSNDYSTTPEILYSAQNQNEWNLIRVPLTENSIHDFEVEHNDQRLLSSMYSVQYGYIVQDSTEPDNMEGDFAGSLLYLDGKRYNMDGGYYNQYTETFVHKIQYNPDDPFLGNFETNFGHLTIQEDRTYFRIKTGSLPDPSNWPTDGQYLKIAYKRHSID